MNGTKRTVIIFSIVFVCLVLFASCVIVAERGHDCIGDKCTVCCVIDAVQRILYSSTVLAIATVLFLVLKFYLNNIFLSLKKHLFSTLILLKVKLSN